MLFSVVSVIALVLSAAALTMRFRPITSFPELILVVGLPFVPVVALVGLAFALSARRRILALVGASLLTATLVIQADWYLMGDPPDIAGPEVRVLASNLRYGRADATEFVELAKENADIITVAELTKEAIERFNQAGLVETFPHSQLIPASGARGIGIWSRYPLIPLTAPRHRNVSIPAALIQVPGTALKPLIASIHITSPVAGEENTVDDWRSGIAGAKSQLNGFAATAGSGAVIVGGDFNSTPDMWQFRDLLTNGYRDAVQQTGAGFAPTFKADSRLPPLITIDHILTRNAAVSSIRTVHIKGSDHRALLATVRIPLEPAT